jgi:hypothetical protein
MTCAERRILNNVLYVRYVRLKKAKPIHMRQPHPLVERQGSVAKVSGRDP